MICPLRTQLTMFKSTSDNNKVYYSTTIPTILHAPQRVQSSGKYLSSDYLRAGACIHTKRRAPTATECKHYKHA